MNTAQVSIELVLAGILAICAFVLPFWRGADISQNLLQADWLVALLGIAYLFGVVFDKLADFILSPMEHYLRLQEADDRLKQHSKSKHQDPFPQDKFEVRLRAAHDGRLDWMNSLRSRIRTSREVAVLGLPASLGIVMYTGFNRACGTNGGPACAASWMYGFIVLNLLFFVAAIGRDELLARAPEPPRQESAIANPNLDNQESAAGALSAVEKEAPTATKKRLKTHQLSRLPEVRERQMRQAAARMRAESIPYFLIVVNSSIAIAVAAALWPEYSWMPLLGAGSFVFSLFALWAWYRITRTYIHFLARAGRLKSRKTGAS